MSLKKANSILKQWTLKNIDTGDSLQGQFAAEIGQEVRNNWQHHTALSRSKAVTMFINSEVDRISVESLFYAKDASPAQSVLLKNKLKKLMDWSKPTAAKQRPAVLKFWSGNGFIEKTCVIAGISNIKYGEPTVTGEIRSVAFTLNLDEFSFFNIKESANYETRYHRTRERDYYEMLCWREYELPMLGDVIRKRHPDKPQLVPGETVKLPSIEAIRTSTVEPKSIALSTAFGRKDTPQRSLRIDFFNRRNIRYTSHLIR